MILIIKLIKEGAMFAVNSVIANKLRTVLTLLGITIGIFAIISVFSVVDSIERQVRASIASLGENVVYIQKWPWGGFDGEYRWWDYVSRPVPQLSELDEIMRRSVTVEAAAFLASTSRRVEYLNTSISNASIVGVSADYDQVRNFEMEDGRFFSALESAAGRNVAVLGYDLAENLFTGLDPIGRTVKVFGHNVVVVGVFEKEGMGFGNSHDDTMVLPINFLSQFINVSQDRFSPFIMVRAYPGIPNAEMIDEITGVMRSIRRLPPVADNNFSLNETSILSEGFDNLFAIIGMAGWIIGGFSILVGGFGIANIMFVSVRERTSIIGIQKALGAKNYFVLWQFLFEAVLLSIMGGSVGLLLVYAGTAAVTSIFEIDFMLSASNILLGINVSAIIGLVSGFVPAWTASRLDPVEAIRSTG